MVEQLTPEAVTVAELRAITTVLMLGGFDLLGNSAILRHARGVSVITVHAESPQAPEALNPTQERPA